MKHLEVIVYMQNLANQERGAPMAGIQRQYVDYIAREKSKINLPYRMCLVSLVLLAKEHID